MKNIFTKNIPLFQQIFTEKHPTFLANLQEKRLHKGIINVAFVRVLLSVSVKQNSTAQNSYIFIYA